MSVHVSNSGTETVFNVKLLVSGVEYEVDSSVGGIASNTEKIVSVKYAVTQENLDDPSNNGVGDVELIYDDSDGIHRNVLQQLTVNIRSKPTEYAVYFQFWKPNYEELLSLSSFEIEVTKGYDGVPFSVSEDVTITRSDDYKFKLKSVPDGYTVYTEYGSDEKNVMVPAFAEASGYSLNFFVIAPDATTSTGDDYMDLALTRQIPGQPWVWP